MIMFTRVLGVWLLMLVIAVGNGVVRVVCWEPWLGAYPAHLVSTVIACAVFVALIWFLLPWVFAQAAGRAMPGAGRRVYVLPLWAVGVSWLLLTVAFEFLAGHYLFGHPWQKLFADYNIRQGRVWLVILAVLLFAPVGVGKLRGIIVKSEASWNEAKPPLRESSGSLSFDKQSNKRKV
jgi:hypothetical protein